MDDWKARRRHSNLLRGVACIVLAACAIAVIELVWDAVGIGLHGQDATESAPHGESPELVQVGYADLAAYAFEGDEAAIGMQGVSGQFVDECFDPNLFGEAHSSVDGGVVGIMSELEASDLFDACAQRLKSRGWLQLEGGTPLRGTFLKEGGKLRWVYLDVMEVSGSSVAVFVLEEAA